MDFVRSLRSSILTIRVTIDAFSRRILAIQVDFEEPSYRSCMIVLRECVRRHNRLPQCLVVDWGPEFCSTYFEALLARYECIKKARPPAKARFGSLVERMFGTTNTQFIYNLLGNTQITRNVRQVTKSFNPKELAVWPLAAFVDQLCRYLYEIYDTNVHPALGESPRDAYHRGFQNTGSRFQRLIQYDHAFMIATMPTTLKGTAMVSQVAGSRSTTSPIGVMPCRTRRFNANGFRSGSILSTSGLLMRLSVASGSN